METNLAVNADQRYEDAPGMSYLAIDQYYRELAWIEPLSKEDEERLLDRVARAQRYPENAHYALVARDARGRLVELFQPLVLKVAKSLAKFFRSMELLDVVNEGSIGLLEAIDHYAQCPGFRGKFVTLAALRIRDALWEARTERDVTVVLPRRVQSLLSKMRKVSRQFELQSGESPSVAELASLLTVSEEQILEALSLSSRQYASSVEQLAYEDESPDEHHHLLSLFPSEGASVGVHQVQLQHACEHVLRHELTRCERDILEMRYGFCGKDAESLEEVARRLEMAPSDVSHVSCRALKRLQPLLEPLVSSSLGRPSFFPANDYYLADEVVSLLGISQRLVQYYTQTGDLPVEYSEVRINNRSGQRKMLFPKQAIDALRASSALSFSAQDYYTAKEVAALLQVDYVTVRRRAVRGDLPTQICTRRSGRRKMLFPKQAIDALLAGSLVSDDLPDLIA